MNRDEALRSAGFTEEFIKRLNEIEKSNREIDYDAELNSIDPEIV